MQKSKRPTFIRIVRIAKKYVEYNFGVSLGDAVNLALFALTIFSLFIALAGVGVAWITYVDASKSGETQEKDLKSAADSLIAAKASLDLSNGQLTSLNNQVAASVAIEKEQQEHLKKTVSLSGRQLDQLQQQQQNMQKNLDISGKQLDQLQKQTEIASRHPKGRMAWYCDPILLPPDTYKKSVRLAGHAGDLQGQWFQETGTLQTGSKGEVVCGVIFANDGTANLTDVVARLRLAVSRMPVSDSTAFSIPYTIIDSTGAFNASTPSIIAEVSDRAPTINLNLDRTIFSRTSAQSFVQAIQLRMTIPKDLGTMTFDWEFGGNEQNIQYYDQYVVVDHSFEGSR